MGLVVPVQLEASRKRGRGFNQAEVIADELARLTGIPMRNDVLFRIRRTRPQKQLGENERRQNLQGAFAVRKNLDLSENLLLIEDIYTTGSTVERRAIMLRLAGPDHVYFLTISMVQGT